MATRPAPPAPGPRGRTGGHRPPHQKNRIGQYIIERTLGTGSFGKVKLATHAITGHQVALKFINRAKITTADMNARVKREIQYLKVLRHPHIIKLYEVITTPTDVIMVMEYAGEELFNYIVQKGKGGMPEDEARRFFQQMVGAIEYCHRHHIVHRDLKPENLFLDSHNNIKIGDFGLSNLMTDGDFLKTSCGSPNYAAPEVISGKLYSGPEIDVWSAGVIMYVLLCGKLPFDDDHIPSLFKKIESGSFHIPSHVSDGARLLLKRMLCVDPLKRATIVEIQQMPFFQEHLPRYLQPLPDVERYPTLPMDDLNTLVLINEGKADPRKVAESKGLMYTEDLGVIDPSVVAELLDKISSYGEEDVWRALQKDGDNQVKVAYQLVRDHRRIIQDSMDAEEEEDAMEDFMASSPPAWNMEMDRTPPSQPPPNGHEELDLGDVDVDIQDIPNAHFEVLDSSLPGYMTPQTTSSSTLVPTPPSDPQTEAERAAYALLSPASSQSQSLAAAAQIRQAASQSQSSTHALAQHADPKPLQKPRWHFGIRSRSPPMEVMLEIYRTLNTLGMQWRRKEGIGMPEIGPNVDEDGYPEEVEAALEQYEAETGQKVQMSRKAPGKKEAAAQEKAAQGLYLVETRARYGDVMVRMDLQLYRIDGANYLVDFRNIGYYKVPDATVNGIRNGNGTNQEGMGTTDQATLDGLKDQAQAQTIGGVSGPFHFLEMACQLIAELANG